MQALDGLPGVKNAHVSFPEKRAVVLYDQTSVAIEQMRQSLLKAGYVATHKAVNKTDPVISHAESSNTSLPQTDSLICYCFEYTKDDIEQDFINNGKSLIMEKIIEEKNNGGCDCTNKNPRGK